MFAKPPGQVFSEEVVAGSGVHLPGQALRVVALQEPRVTRLVGDFLARLLANAHHTVTNLGDELLVVAKVAQLRERVPGQLFVVVFILAAFLLKRSDLSRARVVNENCARNH